MKTFQPELPEIAGKNGPRAPPLAAAAASCGSSLSPPPPPHVAHRSRADLKAKKPAKKAPKDHAKVRPSCTAHPPLLLTLLLPQAAQVKQAPSAPPGTSPKAALLSPKSRLLSLDPF
jgi:hypothetical protein